MKKIYSLVVITALSSLSFGQVVISQVYGGGGNSGAKYTHDFIELFNRGSQAVTLKGHSLQYASATGNVSAANTQVLADITIQPGKYYLIQQAKGNSGTDALPTPDQIPATALALGAMNGKVALVSNVDPITDVTDKDIVDFVGFGTSNEYEGSGPTAALSNTDSAQRKLKGCQDTNDNKNDFDVAAAAPRNGQTAANVCTNLSTDNLTLAKAVSNTLWTNTASFNAKDKTTVEVYNINGQLVKYFEVKGVQNVDVSSLVKGTYVVKTTSNGKSSTQKVVKK
ncbi:MAG: lamin tail domain-containing protein [Empedobacter falsenii]